MIATDDAFAALTPGSVVETTHGRRYKLTEFVPAAGEARAMWWAYPVTFGQRRRLRAADFAEGGVWSVVTVAEPPPPAAPQLVDYGLNRHLSVRHYVRAAPDGGLATRGPSLCLRPIWQIVTSLPGARTQATGLRTCSLCKTKATNLGMTIRAA